MRWGTAAVIVTTLMVGVEPASGTLRSLEQIPTWQFVRAGNVDYARLAQEADQRDAVNREMAKRGQLVTQFDELTDKKQGIARVSWERLQRSSELDRLAFWINAYNLLTVDLIVREWRARKGQVKSIKDVPDAWSRPKWTVAGRSLTLDQIEHDLLRKEFREPRIHFALVCASKSCPALRANQFMAAFLDAQLDSAAREFVLDPSRNDFTPRDGKIRISKIFDWYKKDFVGVYSDAAFKRLYGRELGAVLAYVTRFLPADTVAALRAKRVRVTYLPYDWSLNIAPPAPASPAR